RPAGRGGLLGSGRPRGRQGRADRRPDQGRRRQARPAGRQLPRVVRAPGGWHLPGGPVSERDWHPRQLEAIERRGRVFVSAGAGTGKTAVLVERVVRRVQEGTPLDRMLVITFTDRAAAELKRRVRERLTELGEAGAARAVEGAWISTIHGFCRRVLRANALDAGVDPRF